jgi:hypothetical protein
MKPNDLDPTTLVSCESEPIHLLGAIQSIGFLLSISADWTILRASSNASTFLGNSGEIISRPARDLFSADLIHDIRGRLQIASGTGIVERLLGQRLGAGSPRYDVAVHVSGGETVLEFEPATGDAIAPLSVLRSMMARVERQTSANKVCDEAVRQVRALTQFDRVMLYRFDEDGAGDVIAESANSTVESFLGLRYPASDNRKRLDSLEYKVPVLASFLAWPFHDRPHPDVFVMLTICRSSTPTSLRAELADHQPILTTDKIVTVENSRATRASMKARLPCAANAHLVFLDSLPICEASNLAYSHSGSVAIRIGSS